jgi:hypothetical protein
LQGEQEGSSTTDSSVGEEYDPDEKEPEGVPKFEGDEYTLQGPLINPFCAVGKSILVN